MFRINIVKIQMVKEGCLSYDAQDKKINCPNDAVKLFKQYLGDPDRENFVVLCLDKKNKPTCIHTVSIGSVSASVVHPREVFKVAIESNASSLILCHNHPSGDTTPSKEDIEVTTRLIEAGKILGIDILDHIIVGDDSYSMKSHGIF